MCILSNDQQGATPLNANTLPEVFPSLICALSKVLAGCAMCLWAQSANFKSYWKTTWSFLFGSWLVNHKMAIVGLWCPLFSKYQDGNSKNKTLILSHQRFTTQWVITMTTPIFYIQSTIRPHISSLVLEECEASEFSLNIPPIANTANNNCRHQVLLAADKCD